VARKIAIASRRCSAPALRVAVGKSLTPNIRTAQLYVDPANCSWSTAN